MEYSMQFSLRMKIYSTDKYICLGDDVFDVVISTNLILKPHENPFHHTAFPHNDVSDVVS